jgi:hypothetical protein
MKKCIIFLSTVLALTNIGNAAQAQQIPLYTITALVGLTGDGYTRDDGSPDSNAINLSDKGQVIGYSYRHRGDTSLGESAWFFDSNSKTTQQIGLVGDGYTRTDGFQNSFINTFNNKGQVIGYSDRYRGDADAGFSAWFFDSNSKTTRQIGFVEDGYTRTDGYQESIASTLNNKGQVIGYSNRYRGDAYVGSSAWLFDSNSKTTQMIGLVGDGFTGTDGVQSSSAHGLNDKGQVIGDSYRFTGDDKTYVGFSSWLFDSKSKTTRQIGLVGDGYTKTDGFQYSIAKTLNNDGQAIGYSNRFSGDTDLGTSSWLFDSKSKTTRQIGLVGDAYTRTDGYQDSIPDFINDNGQIVGSSTRFSGNTNLGNSSWFFDNTSNTTQRIGLVGDSYTNYRYSSNLKLNDNGQVIGYSDRFHGDAFTGTSAWFFDSANNTTQQIGLVGDGYTSIDGFQYSSVFSLNNKGQALGESTRYRGNTSHDDSWFFDFDSQQLFDLTFFVNESTGYSSTDANFLADDGTVLGSYWDSSGLLKAFLWNMTDGFKDLGLTISNGLDSEGWSRLYTAFKLNSAGQIYGSGVRANGHHVSYLLSPIQTPVPEPTTILLFGIGLAGVFVNYRKKRARDY